jgi:agmatine deiminase
MDWIFNAWGEKYSCWVQDDQIASAMVTHPTNADASNAATIQRIRADFVLEGGSIHVDGEGTVLVTEECLLHANRNPALTKAQIEERLRVYLGVQSVIWLPHGLTADHDTNGHIDNIACFARPGVALLSWTDEEADEMYAICREAEAILTASVDAQGRTLQVVRLPLPQPMYYTAEECAGDNSSTPSAGASDSTVTGYLREPGARMAGSYVNFYIANGGIIVPSFGQAVEDARAVHVLQEVFGSAYEIVSVPQCREILLGGGNIHCITQQQPLAK